MAHIVVCNIAELFKRRDILQTCLCFYMLRLALPCIKGLRHLVCRYAGLLGKRDRLILTSQTRLLDSTVKSATARSTLLLYCIFDIDLNICVCKSPKFRPFDYIISAEAVKKKPPKSPSDDPNGDTMHMYYAQCPQRKGQLYRHPTASL